MRFAGKKVLVTGAGSNGMGRAIAAGFAREGADIVVHYHSRPEIAADVIAEIGSNGHRAIALQADFSDPAAARELVRQAADRLSGLDVLVAAAAAMVRKSIVETTDEDWQRLSAINLHATFAVASEAAKVMIANGSQGRIVLIGSVTQQLALRNRVAYGATKGGVLQLARGMALELAPYGITVNVIGPGTIITDMNRAVFATDEARAARIKDIPVGRLGTPEDVVEPALFLASPGASYVTGNAIYCDGGMMLP